jgi:uncharacterized protein (TIGR02652 family)
MNLAFQYPIFGAEITCPHCHQTIPALTLTDTYLCPRHGAFESDPHTREIVHLQSGRHWQLWESRWYRQHTHPDGIRFEIHDALDKLYIQGDRAIRVMIAQRYQELINSHLEQGMPWLMGEASLPLLYNLPVSFSPEAAAEPRWAVVNFELDTEPGIPLHYPYFRI